MRSAVSIFGSILSNIWITKLPKHKAACSFVVGCNSFLATSMISFAYTFFFICWCPKWINVFRAVVPCRSKNISSLLCTYSSSLGNTSIIFSKSGLFFSLVFLSKVHSKSNTWFRIEESTIFWSTLCSVVEDLSADKSIGFWGYRIRSLFSTFAVF